MLPLTKQDYIAVRLNNIDKRWYNKIFKVYQYLKQNEIKTVNLLFSGGADSTLVLAALLNIKKKYIPYLEINTLTIELEGLDTFNIEDVTYVLDQLDTSKFTYKYSKIISLLYGSVSDSELSLETKHQAGYAYRYLELFTLCQHNKGISVGTTNSNEFSFIGWFGKHSDMNVDIQFITDLHKFEVNYLLKEHYNIEIYNKPKGGLLSGQTDEEVFECSYDDISYYSYLRCRGFPYIENKVLEDLHKKNSHKYLGQSFNPYFIVDKDYFLQYKEDLLNVK